jgi:hypothetical protein
MIYLISDCNLRMIGKSLSASDLRTVNPLIIIVRLCIRQNESLKITGSVLRPKGNEN